jgi:hypothetical protein
VLGWWIVTRATPPFFVVGSPRSGTKMLRELLNRSPDIWISDIESHFIPEFTRRIEVFGDLGHRPDFDRLSAALRRTRAFWFWTNRGITIGDDRWWAACPRRDWAGVLEGLFRCVHEQEIRDAPRPWAEILWGDKTPAYMTEMPLLGRVFPQARFVHLIRDPRDCCLSAEKTWGHTPLRTAQNWADRVARCRADGAVLGPARYHELRYEDLVADVRGRLGAIFDFLGVPTPPDAGQFLRVPENLGDAKGRAEVIASNTRKWAKAMSPALRRRIEAVTGDLLDQLGYEREYPTEPARRLSAASMAWYRLRDAWRQVEFRRREHGGWVKGIRFLLAR